MPVHVALSCPGITGGATQSMCRETKVVTARMWCSCMQLCTYQLLIDALAVEEDIPQLDGARTKLHTQLVQIEICTMQELANAALQDEFEHPPQGPIRHGSGSALLTAGVLRARLGDAQQGPCAHRAALRLEAQRTSAGVVLNRAQAICGLLL